MFFIEAVAVQGRFALRGSGMGPGLGARLHPGPPGGSSPLNRPFGRFPSCFAPQNSKLEESRVLAEFSFPPLSPSFSAVHSSLTAPRNFTGLLWPIPAVRHENKGSPAMEMRGRGFRGSAVFNRTA